MTQDTRIALFLMGELIAAIRAIDPETFKEWLCGGIKDMGRPAVEELMIEWMNPLFDEQELHRVDALHMRVSLLPKWGIKTTE